MPLDEAGLMAAVDSGIASASGSPTPTPATTTAPTGGTTDEQVEDGSDSTAVSSADETASGEQPAGNAVAESDGESGGASTDEHAADGDGAASTPLGADGKPVVAAGSTTAKEPDPLNDPLPNALKKETKERIHTLVDRVKTAETKLTETTRDLDNMLGAVVNTGATPQQYQQSLAYLQLVNSPSRADKEKALEIMQGEIKALATMLGKPVPGVNFLEGHDDLIQAVGRGQITQQHAMELAAARAAQGHVRQVEQRVTTQQTEQDQHAQAVQSGRQALVTLEAQLRRDPQFEAKKAQLVPILRPTFQKLHPSQWAGAFKQAYDAFVLPAAPRPALPTAATPGASPAGAAGNTPLRAANAGGAQTVSAPKNAFEAVEFGITQARG